jgi:hypothetical protein
MADSIEISNKCLNCGKEVEESFKFCPNCGQSTYQESDLKSFTKHFMSDYFTFDSKIFKSIIPLFGKPGFLTIEYLQGRKIRYIAPLRLFIFSSIIFFLLLGLLDNSSLETASSKIDQETLAWNSFFSSWLPKLFFIFSPLFALLLALFFKKRQNSYLVHFLFSLHFHATIFLLGIVYILLSWIFSQLGWIIVNQVFLILSLIFLAVYLWKALRNVYEESRGKTFYKFILLSLFYSSIIIVTVVLLALFLI